MITAPITVARPAPALSDDPVNQKQREKIGRGSHQSGGVLPREAMGRTLQNLRALREIRVVHERHRPQGVRRGVIPDRWQMADLGVVREGRSEGGEQRNRQEQESEDDQHAIDGPAEFAAVPPRPLEPAEKGAETPQA